MKPHKCCGQHPTITERHKALATTPERVHIFCEHCQREVVAVTVDGAVREWNGGDK